MKTEKFPWWKFILGFILYLLFHELHDLLGGNMIGVILSEAIDGVYPHMKMLFYAYLIVSIVDFFVKRKNSTLGLSFFYSRMLILSAVPWMMIAMYYVLEAVGIPLPGWTELVWGILLTLVGIYFAIRLEEPFDNLPMRNAVKAMIVLAFIGSLITYIGFSFNVPDNFFYVDG